jgi:hypothetical protein
MSARADPAPRSARGTKLPGEGLSPAASLSSGPSVLFGLDGEAPVDGRDLMRGRRLQVQDRARPGRNPGTRR